jgi:hypothetical protein
MLSERSARAPATASLGMSLKQASSVKHVFLPADLREDKMKKGIAVTT